MRVSALLFSLAASSAIAQNTPPPQVARPVAAPQATTVTAVEPLPLDAADRSVFSVDRSDPVTQPLFNSPVDFLRQDPSVTLQERSPNGVQADLSIRGTTFEQTLVLLNGLRLNDPETGHLNLDIPLPLEAISRIDVLHGSGSTFFGSDAIGGAVNLITAAPKYASATVRLGGGNMGSTEQHVQVSGIMGRFGGTLSGSRDTSDGFLYGGQIDRGYHANLLSVDTFTTLTPKLAATEIFLGASDRPYGANLFYGPYESNERTKGWLASVRQPLPANLTADFAYRRHTDLFVLEVFDPALYENNHIDTLWQSDLRGTHAAGSRLDVAYGLEADGDSIRSNSLGKHARNQGAGYASLQLHGLKRLTLQVGAREEIFRGPASVFSPSASAGFFLGHGLRAHAAAGHGFRLPTYVDLYYADPTTIGNPMLKPETSQSYEGGLEWIPNLRSSGTQPRLKFSATGFTLRQSNAIDYSKYTLTAPYQATNIGHIAYTGVESLVTLRPGLNQEFSLGETFLHAGPPPAGLISEYAYNYASHNGSFAWQATFPSLQLAARTQVSVVQQTTRTAYPLWTVALTRSQGRIRPYVRAEDLANVSYQELPGVPLAGRTIMAGITFSWPAVR